MPGFHHAFWVIQARSALSHHNPINCLSVNRVECRPADVIAAHGAGVFRFAMRIPGDKEWHGESNLSLRAACAVQPMEEVLESPARFTFGFLHGTDLNKQQNSRHWEIL